MSKKMTTERFMRNTLNKLIKNISYIAIFLALGLIVLVYAGPDIVINTKVVVKLAVPSVILAISITVIYELWITNGQQSAAEEVEYRDLVTLYNTKSEGLHYSTLQDFLDYERERRYTVEYNSLNRLIERETVTLSKLKPKTRSYRKTQKLIKTLTKAQNTIVIKLPYERSEEFDYLRYNARDINYKEYSPEDTAKHIRHQRIYKYTKTFTGALVGVNLVSFTGAPGDIWTAIIMSTIAAVMILMAVISGFNTGFKNISIISTGIYKTGNSFIDQAVAYCQRNQMDLYYKGTTEFREVLEVVEVKPEQVDNFENIFTNLTDEVTE